MTVHGVSTPIVASVLSAALAGVGWAVLSYYWRDKKSKLPEYWTQVGTIKDICVYPIKSCGEIKLETAECSTLGLRDFWLRDRILMVVDEKRNFITARAYPELLLVHTSVKGSILTLTNPNLKPISIDLAKIPKLFQSFTASVWGTAVPVYDCGQEASDWFTKLLNKPNSYRLVYYASDSSRAFRPNANERVFKYKKQDKGAFPDDASYNLINEASVEELNSRLVDTKVSVRNFRPNFVLSGAKPHDEDHWKFVKIGNNIFEVIQPCVRCVLTTIDPETGVRNPKAEPLDTLKKLIPFFYDLFYFFGDHSGPRNKYLLIPKIFAPDHGYCLSLYRLVEEPEMRQAVGDSPRMGLQMALRSPPGTRVNVNDPVYAPC